MFLPPKEAAKLVNAALTPKTAAARMKASEKVLKAMTKIAADGPGLRWDDFQERFLRDCLETDQCAKAMVFLDSPSFSAKQMKALLEPVVAIYLRLGKTAHALEWIDIVSAVYGIAKVRGLAKKPGLEALAKNKKFIAMTGPGAELARFESELKDAMRMWKRDEYDNYKDAIEDAKQLHKGAAKHGTKQVAAAKKHLDAVVTEVKRLMKDEPDLAKYLKGLV